MIEKPDRDFEAEREHYQRMLDQQPQASVEYTKRKMAATGDE
jgi:hypothetical protein